MEAIASWNLFELFAKQTIQYPGQGPGPLRGSRGAEPLVGLGEAQRGIVAMSIAEPDDGDAVAAFAGFAGTGFGYVRAGFDCVANGVS
jgi:hypothetical protein